MRFQRSCAGTVELASDALAHILANRQLGAAATEAGGILLGRLIAGTADMVVDRASGPVLEDIRTRFFFFRARAPAQRAVNEAWHTSNGTSNYLGEWHTHPEDDPSASPVDIGDWRRVIKRARFEQNGLLFIIVGRTTLRVWELLKGEPKPKLLTLLPS